jgi:hypothetical protein
MNRLRRWLNSDFLTSQENALAHFQIVARASCPCYLEIFHGRDAHATKPEISEFFCCEHANADACGT